MFDSEGGVLEKLKNSDLFKGIVETFEKIVSISEEEEIHQSILDAIKKSSEQGGGKTWGCTLFAPSQGSPRCATSRRRILCTYRYLNMAAMNFFPCR